MQSFLRKSSTPSSDSFPRFFVIPPQTRYNIFSSQISSTKSFARCLLTDLTYHAIFIGLNQSAFILGRSMSDYILLSHDLVRGFHIDNGPFRMFIKIDLRKAFETISWYFYQEFSKGNVIFFPLGQHDYWMHNWILSVQELLILSGLDINYQKSTIYFTNTP